MIIVPKTEQILLSRCQHIAGKTLGQVAHQHGVLVPSNLRRHKGWVGSLLEHVLGADAGSRAEPDFTGLGIEMKTLPLNKRHQPKESTYICTLSLSETGQLSWEQSWLRRKLSRVLWIPIEADPSITLAERYIGQAWLWEPTLEQDAMLKQDWEDLIEMIISGEVTDITAREGQFLQIRPKAAHSRVLAKGVSSEGESQKMNPKGFYLRTVFTNLLLQKR